MNVKVRRLLKGLRYISHIFGEGEEQKDEFKIGFPTNVKHVAHIGCTGAAVTGPSWMKEFRETKGGVESDALATLAPTIDIVNSRVGSTSRQVMKTKEPNRQNKSRRRKKKVNKKDDYSLRSSATSPCRVVGESSNIDKSKHDSVYGSAHGSSDDECSINSYATLDSCTADQQY